MLSFKYETTSTCVSDSMEYTGMYNYNYYLLLLLLINVYIYMVHSLLMYLRYSRVSELFNIYIKSK